MRINWYMTDPRFEPGTVADVGYVRVYIRKRGNKWRLYVAIRTKELYGVYSVLKREVCVGQWPSSFSLEEIQRFACGYLCDLSMLILGDITEDEVEDVYSG